MFDLFMKVMRPASSSSVLDIGVTPDESLPESNYFEKLYPYKDRIVAASIEDASFLEKAYPGLRFVMIGRDGRLPFADDQFDILFCSAVLEHVGDTESQRKFIGECIRVSRSFFITTPDRRFPVEFHTILPFLHWLPRSLHQAALRGLGLGFWASTENLNLLTPKEFTSLVPPVAELSVFKCKTLGLPSNVVISGRK
ncbi:MAG: methyltransferase domain-containing protein [Deltaproteobacteria bacterium]|nr:methyltransferase domain-containing protein [Deltaproteobacteria bacterium]